MKSIEEAVAFMEAVAADDSHGYDQTYRMGPNYDCSSLVGTALHKAGYNVNPGSTTRNLYSQLQKENFQSLPVSGIRKRGDIFLTPGKHVVMCISGGAIVHASINEKGKITGGKSGDQTGKEICTRSFYVPSYGWRYHLRAPQVTSPNLKVDYAKSYNAGLKGEFITTTSLRLRTGAGLTKKIQVVMPKGTLVKCYGYFTNKSNIQWLLVELTIQDTPYIGFCSSRYLNRA